ncbi:hypothetical protein F4820DRAFT_90303 [Hypoxylon rubiginosum]|uniref:Uncharacterized protein n=1 Tax=Hypoxylon rubiginosum TaxID=110542 RepID=A0ACB9ZAM4_9PEZI|nr:hypothetical protein F4820DRAFT_90303 [Hypoxylon rubiginosum]
MRQVRKVLKKPLVRRRLEDAGITLQFKEDDKDPEITDVSAFRDELLALSFQPAFGKFDLEAFRKPGEGPCNIKDVYNADWIASSLEQASSQIKDTSPRLFAFLSALLANQRVGRKAINEGKGDASFPIAKAYIIMALFLGAYAHNRCNFLPQSIGIYLYHNKVQSRVINTLARFGICPGYTTIMKLLEQMADQSRAHLSNQDSIDTPTQEPVGMVGVVTSGTVHGGGE